MASGFLGPLVVSRQRHFGTRPFTLKIRVDNFDGSKWCARCYRKFDFRSRCFSSPTLGYQGRSERSKAAANAIEGGAVKVVNKLELKYLINIYL